MATRHSIGITARTAVLSLLMALATLSAILIAMTAFADYQRVVTRLVEEQNRALMAASRLVQQSEGLVGSSAMLVLADSHAQRRQAMFEVDDRRAWIESLVSELAQLRKAPEDFDNIRQISARLGRRIAELNAMVTQRIDLRGALAQGVPSNLASQALLAGIEVQIADVMRDKRVLSRDLGIAVGFHTGAIREEIQQTVEALETSISQRKATLTMAMLGVLLMLLATVAFIHRFVAQRVTRLQHAMSHARPLSQALDYRGGDEIACMATTIGRYLDRINDNETRILAMNRELQFLATHDALTQLHNRHHFDRVLNEQTATLAREPYAVAMLDIDHFKQVNDTFGHQQGDEVIREVARQLREAMPPPALVARLGGEEFAVLCQTGDPAVLARRLDTLRCQLARTPVVVAGQKIPVTVSIGLARKIPGSDVQACLQAADDALYEAKRQGRNQLVVRRLRQDDPEERA